MDFPNSNSSDRFPASPTVDRMEAEPRFVIQRTGETFREWWTGEHWSNDENQALEYSHEPDVSVETSDESAKVMRVDQIDD